MAMPRVLEAPARAEQTINIPGGYMNKAVEVSCAISLLAGLFSWTALPSDVAAEPVTDFYRGKSITLLIAAAPGATYDTAGRLMVRHMGQYIPGAPTLVPQNMPGGGGLRMANLLANASDKQGLTIGLHLTGAIHPAILGDPAAKFDPIDLTWLGTMSSAKNDAYLLTLRGERDIRTVEDLRRPGPAIKLGSVGGIASNAVFAMLSSQLFGFNTQQIKGYVGAAGVMMAVQTKEVDGAYFMLSSLSLLHGDMLRTGALVPLVQFARQTRHPDFPDVPLGRELLSSPDDQALLAFAESTFFIGLPFSAPAGIPDDRARALGEAFMKANGDAAYMADAAKMNIDVSPLDGAAVTDLIAKMKATPAPVLARYNKMIGGT